MECDSVPEKGTYSTGNTASFFNGEDQKGGTQIQGCVSLTDDPSATRTFSSTNNYPDEACFNNPDGVVYVKVENEVLSEDEYDCSDSSANFFETGKDLAEGIKIEGCDTIVTDVSSSFVGLPSYSGSDVSVETDIIIKKEDDLNADVEESEKMVESCSSPRNVVGSECDDESAHSVTLSDKASESPAWGLCEESGGVSSPTGTADELLGKSSKAEMRDRSSGRKVKCISAASDDTDLVTPTVVKPFSCSLCPAEFKLRNLLKKHLVSHSHEKPFSCPHCPTKFKRTIDLNRHLQTHSNDKPFLCTHCPARFRRRDELRRHGIRHSDERPFACVHCSVRSKSKYALQMHLLTHSDDKPFPCQYCPQKFNRKHGLECHLKTHFDKGLFPCTHCPSKLRSKASLTRHLRIHTTTEKTFTCTYCSVEFNGKSSLKTHLLTHTLSKNILSLPDSNPVVETNVFVKKEVDLDATEEEAKALDVSFKPSIASKVRSDCNNESSLLATSCDKISESSAWGLYVEGNSTSSSEKADVLTQSDERRISCSLCPAKFKRTNDLKKHLCTHTDERPFSCPHCPAKFKLKCHLNVHLAIHTNREPVLAIRASEELFLS